MPYTRQVFSFIETKLFTRLVQEYLTDEEYSNREHLGERAPTDS